MADEIFTKDGIKSLENKFLEKIPMEVNIDNGTGKIINCKVVDVYLDGVALMGRCDNGMEIILGISREDNKDERGSCPYQDDLGTL